ncbi:condensation domain-containing protein [Streptomyces sp. NPDC051001]|uniref:condensation domain-containing protein n=1 Tax=Streptomyces sp. NPDC051001 TaxID=3155795 RepID=UPI00341B9BF6
MSSTVAVHRIPDAQQQMWFASRVSRNPAGYLIPLQLRISGAVDVDALERALRAIVARHEVLRTGVGVVDGEVAGVLRDEKEFTLGVRRVDSTEELDEVLVREALLPVDPETGLPLRAVLVRCAESEWVLALTVHHLAFDGWSRDLFFEELETLYGELVAGRPAWLAPLAAQYRDLALAREQRESADALAEQVEYWRAALAGLVPFELPPDRPRPPVRGGQGDQCAFAVPDTVAADLRRLALRCHASLHMVLVAACQVVLGGRAGRRDVTVGSTYSTRDAPGYERAIGLFVNMAVLRGDLSGDPTFAELVSRTRDTALDGYEARDVPFPQVVRALGAGRDTSRTPLFQILIDLVARQRRAPALPGLLVEELPSRCVGSKYDLSIAFDDSGANLTAELGWDTALYERATMTTLADELRGLLVRVAGAPDMRLSEIRRAGVADAFAKEDKD